MMCENEPIYPPHSLQIKNKQVGLESNIFHIATPYFLVADPIYGGLEMCCVMLASANWVVDFFK